MLLGRLDVSQLHIGEGEAVHGLRVLGIDLEGAAQIVESPQAVALLAEDGAQVLEGHGIPGIGGKSLHGVLLGPRQVARPLVAERQGHAGVRVAGSELEAAVQQLSPLIELAEVHVAEAQVVEEIGILGILAEELLQVDAGLVELAGGEELQSLVKVVHRRGRWDGQILKWLSSAAT